MNVPGQTRKVSKLLLNIVDAVLFKLSENNLTNETFFRELQELWAVLSSEAVRLNWVLYDNTPFAFTEYGDPIEFSQTVSSVSRSGPMFITILSQCLSQVGASEIVDKWAIESFFWTIKYEVSFFFLFFFF